MGVFVSSGQRKCRDISDHLQVLVQLSSTLSKRPPCLVCAEQCACYICWESRHRTQIKANGDIVDARRR